jgi:hypothetical protein
MFTSTTSQSQRPVEDRGSGDPYLPPYPRRGQQPPHAYRGGRAPEALDGSVGQRQPVSALFYLLRAFFPCLSSFSVLLVSSRPHLPSHRHHRDHLSLFSFLFFSFLFRISNYFKPFRMYCIRSTGSTTWTTSRLPWAPSSSTPSPPSTLRGIPRRAPSPPPSTAPRCSGSCPTSARLTRISSAK